MFNQAEEDLYRFIKLHAEEICCAQLSPVKIFTDDKVTIEAFVLLTGRQKNR
jgi:hypothetical protein